MPTINFPSNPTVGQTYDFDSKRYRFDGIKWTTIKFTGPSAVSLVDEHKAGADQHPILGVVGLRAELDARQKIADIVGLIDNGAIIEEGSNANGSYVKLKNGTMICIRDAKVDLGSLSVYVNLFQGSFTWTYPQPFTRQPACSITITRGTSATWAVPAYSDSGVTGLFRVFDVAATASDVTVCDTVTLAIGRWK